MYIVPWILMPQIPLKLLRPTIEKIGRKDLFTFFKISASVLKKKRLSACIIFKKIRILSDITFLVQNELIIKISLYSQTLTEIIYVKAKQKRKVNVKKKLFVLT